MEKKRYLVPHGMSVGQFIHILSSRLHLAANRQPPGFSVQILQGRGRVLVHVLQKHENIWFDEQKDQVSLEQTLRVVFMDVDRPCREKGEIDAKVSYNKEKLSTVTVKIKKGSGDPMALGVFYPEGP